MHPNPLLRVFSDLALDGGGGGGSQLLDLVRERAIGRHRQGGVDHALVSAVGAPVDEAGEQRASHPDREHGGPGGGPRGMAEEGHENAGDVLDVLVDEESTNPISRQGAREPATGGRSPRHDVGAEAGAHGSDEVVQPRVVQLSNGRDERYAGHWQKGAEQLPVAAVAGRENGAAAALEGGIEVLHTFDLANGLDLGRSSAPHPGNLGQHEAEVADAAGSQRVASVLVKLRESDLEMGVDPLPAARKKLERHRAQLWPDGAVEPQGKTTPNLEKGPKTQVECETTATRRHKESVAGPARTPGTRPTTEAQRMQRETQRKTSQTRRREDTKTERANCPQITQIDADHRIDWGGVTVLTGRADTTHASGFLNRKDAKDAKSSILM